MSYTTIRAASLANFAYYHNTMQTLGAVLIEHQATDTEVYVLPPSDTFPYVNIVFRGTEANVKDWRKNLDTSFENFYGLEAHRGYLRAYRAISSILEAHLNSLPTAPIMVFGHSAGGAKAQLAAVHLAYTGRVVQRCYSFGSPRLFHQDSALYIESQVQGYLPEFIRYVNLLDPVPRVPLRMGLYRHISNPRLILKDRIVRNPTAWHWTVAAWQSQYPTWKNHAMSEYHSKVSTLSSI